MVAVCNLLVTNCETFCLITNTLLAFLRPLGTTFGATIVRLEPFVHAVSVTAVSAHSSHYASLQKAISTRRAAITGKSAVRATEIEWHLADRAIFVFCIPHPKGGCFPPIL